jgi:hypothetical protein
MDAQMAIHQINNLGYGERSRSVASMQRALNLFYRAYLKGRVQRWLHRWLTGQDSTIMDLSVVAQELNLHHRWSGGLHAIPLEQIMGSMGRTKDFDIDFAPLHQKSEGRWTNLALARFSGAVLPPIEVIQVNQVYFVKDGHHRVSVAKALGERYIEAEVTVWS